MTDQTTTTGVETNAAPTPGSPEYDATMAAKFRDSQSVADKGIREAFQPADDGAAQKPAKPDNVPDKFWDAETGTVRVDDVLKSYAELEAKGTKPADKPDGQQGQSDADKAAQEAATKAGLNWDDLGSKISAKGDIEESDYEALAKAGVPKELAQNYVRLVKSETERATNDAIDYIGGGKDHEANVKATGELLDWARTNLSKEQIEGYNTMLAGPQWKVAVDTLKTLRGQTNPGNGEPALVTSRTALGGGTTVGYKTEDEMRADMRNPIYFQQTPEGEKFRAQVQEKVRLAAYRQNR